MGIWKVHVRQRDERVERLATPHGDLEGGRATEHVTNENGLATPHGDLEAPLARVAANSLAVGVSRPRMGIWKLTNRLAFLAQCHLATPHGDLEAASSVFAPPARLATPHGVRIPTKPAMHSKMKPATCTDLKPAGVPIEAGHPAHTSAIEAMMFRRGGLVKRAWVSGLRGRRRMGGL